ncbi:MAG: tetratricopeptide repeat protein [Minicystis sp.]
MNERTRILFIASNPLRDTPVAVDVEARAIQEQIDLAQARDRFDLGILSAPRTGDILRENALRKPQLVHVTGHGTAKELLFLGADDQPTSIAIPALVQLMEQLGADEARVVVLNYCASAAAAQAIVADAAGRIAFAVGTRAAIPDRHAIAFAAAFYGAIAMGRDLARAFAEGSTQVALAGGKADAFTFHARAGADAATFTIAPEVCGQAAPPASDPPAACSAPVPVAPAPVLRAQMRSPPADFTGRTKEMADVRALFGQTGVLVSGQGGVGKTALALELAQALGELYPDAQIDVGLRGSSPAPLEPKAAMAEVIHAFYPELRLPEGDDAVADLYRATLHGKRVLLLLDDAKDEAQIRPLLPPTGSFVLVTAWSWFVVEGIAPYDLPEMTPPDAIALARRIAARLLEGEAAELASRCGYLPLSVRAAAGTLAQRRDLKPAQYLQKLRSATERVKLVEAVLREGVELLEPEVRKAWACLGVFPADFEARCAAALLDVDVDRGAEILSEILQRNLIEWDEASGRYRMHDLARDYARTRLDAAALAAAWARFADHYADVAEHADALYRTGGTSTREGLALFDVERQNIETAIAWAMDHAEADAGARLCRLAIVCASILALRANAHDRIGWFSSALAAARRAGDDASQIVLLGNLSTAHLEVNELAPAAANSEAQRALAQKLGDRRSEAIARGNQGIWHWLKGEVDEAVSCFEEQLTVARAVGDRRIEADALGNLGNASWSRKDLPRAASLYEERLALTRALGDKRGEGTALGNLATTRWLEGRPDEALALYEERLALARSLGDKRGEGSALGNLGTVYRARGEIPKAIDLLEQHLAIARDLDDLRAEQHALIELDAAYRAAGDAEKSDALEGRRFELFTKVGNPNPDLSWNLGDGELPKPLLLMQIAYGDPGMAWGPGRPQGVAP